MKSESMRFTFLFKIKIVAQVRMHFDWCAIVYITLKKAIYT